MKNIIILFALTFLLSCEDDFKTLNIINDKIDSSLYNTPCVTVYDSLITFNGQGISDNSILAVSSHYTTKWQVKSSSEWVIVEPKAYTGNKEIEIKALVNYGEKRRCKLTFSSDNMIDVNIMIIQINK